MRGNFLVGVAVGAAAVWFGAGFGRSSRPLAKSAIRAGILAYLEARGAVARFGEEVEDLIAETMNEMAEVGDGDVVIRAGGPSNGG